jgi:hypothetical protein
MPTAANTRGLTETDDVVLRAVVSEVTDVEVPTNDVPLVDVVVGEEIWENAYTLPQTELPHRSAEPA